MSPRATRTALPPGQRRVEGFPRFGTHLRRPPPAVPADAGIAVTGVVGPLFAAVSDLRTLPRRTITADFHCVAGWSATGLEWTGVPFAEFHRAVIEPAAPPDVQITHFVFEGLDGYRSVVTAEDALADDVLLADHLDGEPLDGDHGAPVRLISPRQYGFISTKHLCRIEVHASAPAERYHPSFATQLGLQLVRPHRRARVWHEERHRHLPGWLVRPVYHALIPVLRSLIGGRRARRSH